MSSPEVALAPTPAKTQPAERGYAAVLVHVRAGGAKLLAGARAIAAQLDAELIGVGAEAAPPIAAGPATGLVQAQWYSAASAAAEANLTTARAMFDQACVGLKQGGQWAQSLQLPIQTMACESRSADLIIAGPASHGASSYVEANPAELAMSSGRPVLVLAPDVPSPKFQRIVLAWKDTRETRRAMSDALPLLRRAQSVLVLTVCTQGPAYAQEVLDDVAEALGRHGVKTQTKVVTAQSHEAQHILEAAETFGADLVVAGCYGRSRLGEWLFGGVTHDLLAQRRRHILLSH